jgi:hypothetical protein
VSFECLFTFQQNQVVNLKKQRSKTRVFTHDSIQHRQISSELNRNLFLYLYQCIENFNNLFVKTEVLNGKIGKEINDLHELFCQFGVVLSQIFVLDDNL